MPAVKTNHNRNEQVRAVEMAMKQWDREDQAKEAAEVRRHNGAARAHRLKRLYPNRSHIEYDYLKRCGISYELHRAIQNSYTIGGNVID